MATAFHRNTMTNTEGGTDDEEFRVAAVKDRVDTTMQVWMGLTMGCAKCHSHKYDPITQEEYYQFYAFFNQTADADQRRRSPSSLPRRTAIEEQLKARSTRSSPTLKEKLDSRIAGARRRAGEVGGADLRVAPSVAMLEPVEAAAESRRDARRSWRRLAARERRPAADGCLHGQRASRPAAGITAFRIGGAPRPSLPGKAARAWRQTATSS